MNKASINLDYKKRYGQNYANLRKKEYNGKKDYSVRELAKILGLSPTSISFIETEQREPTIEQVKIYKKQFGVSLDFLTGETKVIHAEYRDICDFTVLSEVAVIAHDGRRRCCSRSRSPNVSTLQTLNVRTAAGAGAGSCLVQSAAQMSLSFQIWKARINMNGFRSNGHAACSEVLPGKRTTSKYRRPNFGQR